MIFKQIDSSVDKTRKTLALFNKDWNTYKSNWQNANGLFGKIGSIFSSSKVTSNNIISNDQLQILRNWNNAVKHGCTNQETFNRIIADADENTKMYFAGLNKGKGSVEGLKNAQNTAETSTIGLTIAQTALNTAINMGIGLAISYAIKGISKLINYQKELIDKSQEAISVFEESRDALTNNKQTIDEISSDYTRLAQGVDSLGRNVSLNTEEYTRYNEIVNQIADMFPQMVQGYTDEGNAIIINKGNVEELTKAYEEQKKAYQDLVITKSADTFVGYKAKVAETPWTESLKGKNGTYAYIEQKKYIDELIKSLEDGEQAFENFYSNQYIKNSDIYNVLNSATKTAGIDWGGVMDTDKRYEQMKSQMTKLYAYQRQLISNINTETSKIKPIMSAYMGQSYDYQSLDSDVQDVVKQIVGQFDSEFYTQFDNETDMATWVTENIVNKFKGIDGEKITEAFKNSIDLKTKLQNGEISLDDYLSGINEFKMLIDGFDDNTKKSVDLIFNVNSSNGLSTDTLVNNVKEKLQDDFDGKVGELTLEELHIAAEQVEVPEGTLLSWDELIAKIKEVQSSTSNIENPISTITSSVQQLATQLEPQFAKLGEAYKAIFTDDGFTLDDVDNSMLEDLRTTFAEIEEEVGVAFDASVLNPFFDTLTNKSSTVEQVQDAFNNLATAYFYSTETLEQLNEETATSIEKQLEEMGVVNASEVVYDALNAKTEALALQKQFAAQTGYELVDATAAEITSFLNHAGASKTARAYLFQLIAAEQVFGNTDLNTADKVAKLKELATAYGQTAIAARIANMEKAAQDGHISVNYDRELASLQNEINSAISNVKVDFSKIGGGKSSAKSAGKDAGKEIKDGLKEELSDLEGIISSLSKAIDDQKEVITSQKEVALEAIESQISALESERDARLAVIEAEKAQLEAQIRAIDKQIDAKQKEIDAINDVAKARQHEIDLQKAQYELERMQNQRTILQYSEDKGMHYVADESGIRDAKESVDDAKRQLDIDAIEKEIDLLEESKDLLNEQIDLLEEQADNINKFYDSQIKALEKQKESTEKYFESLMKSIESSKDKYQELLDIVDKAELSGKLKQLGIDEEALLAGSEEEFQKLKDAYLGVVSQLNEGNEEFLSSLRELSGYEGTAPIVLSDTTDKLSEMNTQLDGSTESMSKLSDSATTASEGTSAIATNMGELGTSTEGISDNLTNINDVLNGLPEAENINAISDAFTNMGEAIKGVATALGVGEEGTVGGLVGALQSLSEISLGEMGGEGQGGGTGIVSQFQVLKTAVDDVTNAISGGGSSGSTGSGDASNSSSPSMSAGAGGEGASGLVGAIESFKSATDEALGSGGEEGEGSDGGGSGAIGQFGQLKEAVDEVTTAIGSGDSEGGSGDGGDEDAANLIGAINNLGETTEEILAGGGESDGNSGGVIGRFGEFKDVIGEANEHVTGISEGLTSIDGQEVECTIKVNIETTGGLPAGLAHSTGTALDTMKLESAEYNAKYLGNAHVEGTALASGDWAVQSDEQSALVGEEGFEIIVRNGRFFTVGNNGAEMTDIKKGDIVFNHEQSKNLLKYGHISGRGKAYADGTVGGGKILTKNGEILRPLQPGDKMYDLVQKFEAYFKSIDGNLEKLVPNSLYEQNREWNKIADQITYANSVVNNNRNVQQPVINGGINITCPGVTSKEVAQQVSVEVDRIFNGMHLEAEQRSRMR